VEPGADAESERRLHAVLRRAKLRGWVAQYPIELPGGTVFVDVAFPERRAAIEIDGRRYHDEYSDRFESDRLRQNQIVLLGWRVLRFTWRALRDEPDLVISRIVQLLAA
jgi:very-short-patch-repair endonuclease